MAYLTQFSIPALLNPMINRMANEVSAILLLICSHKVWVNVTYFWSTALCLAHACVYANPVLQHKHKHKKNERVCFFFLCLCLCLCNHSFHLLTHVLVLMLMRWWKLWRKEKKRYFKSLSINVRKVGPLTLFSNIMNDYDEQTATE